MENRFPRGSGLFDCLEEEGKGESEISSHFLSVVGKAGRGSEIKRRGIVKACLANRVTKDRGDTKMTLEYQDNTAALRAWQSRPVPQRPRPGVGRDSSRQQAGRRNWLLLKRKQSKRRWEMTGGWYDKWEGRDQRLLSFLSLPLPWLPSQAPRRTLRTPTHSCLSSPLLRASDKLFLLDQCERYRRCRQCQRSTSNGGHNHQWPLNKLPWGSGLFV